MNSRAYKTMQMLEVPAIEGHEPLEILLFHFKLNEVLFTTQLHFGADFAPAHEFEQYEYNERYFKKMIGRIFTKLQEL